MSEVRSGLEGVVAFATETPSPIAVRSGDPRVESQAAPRRPESAFA